MPSNESEQPQFFSNAQEFRGWLEANHDREDVLWVGYYKVHTGRPSMTWNESVDQALCFGWIDGKRKSIDTARYMIRFTPRRRTSIWSDKNLRRMEELIQMGCVHAAGLAAYDNRSEAKSIRYSYEQSAVVLSREENAALKSDRVAWEYFQSLSPSARRASIWWVISPKRTETRARRFRTLLKCCREGCRIPPLVNAPRKKK